MTLSATALHLRAHGLEEFCTLFGLGERERQLSILAVGDAPSSFNADGTITGMRIVSADPLYALRAAELGERLGEVANASPAAGLAIGSFLTDYEPGLAQGRYVTGTAIDLPFPDGSYDLALCAHSLFVEGAGDLAWHLRALRELTRVAEEVRIAPLGDTATPSSLVRAVTMAATRMGFRVEAEQRLVISR